MGGGDGPGAGVSQYLSAAVVVAFAAWVAHRSSPGARARRAERRQFLADVEAGIVPGDLPDSEVPGDLRPGGLVSRSVPVPGGPWARVPQPRRPER